MERFDLTSKVIDLRLHGLTPKQIAKTLGMRRAEVEPILREHAQGIARTAATPAVVGCWASPGWSCGLRWEGHPDWHDDCPVHEEAIPRLASVLIAREHRYGRVSVCGYLVDSHCLGVKNAIGPRIIERVELSEFQHTYFSTYDEPPQTVPLDLAQDLVLGAVDYARRLGFAPRPDFEVCREHLGGWAGPSAIEFGYRGKPCFIPGPHDDAPAILSTLERAVGRGNFTYLAM